MSPKKPHKWLVLAVLCLSVFLVVVDNTIVNVALPSLSGQLHASNSALQWIVDAYSLPFAGLLLAGGGLSDRLGRKRVMQVGLLFFAAFSALSAWSHSASQLITARALMGLAAAFIFPATLSILTITFTDARDRAKAYGIWGATSGLAVAFGPLTGGALIEHFWWGSVFLVNLPLVAITMVAGQIVIPESKSEFNRKFDFTGLVLGSSGITLLVLAIIQGPNWGWRSTTTLGLFAGSVALLAGFIVWERRRAEPLLDVRVFAKPAFSAGATSIAASFFCLFGFIFLLTQYFQLVRGYSALSAGVHTLPFAFTSMVVTPLGALLALRIGTRWVVGTGLVLMGVSLVWMGGLPADASFVGPILGVAVVGSAFSSVFGPQVLHALGTTVPSAVAQTASESMQAALGTVRALPASVGHSIEPHIVSSFMNGLHRGCFVAAGAAFALSLLAFFLLPTKADQPPVTVAAH